MQGAKSRDVLRVIDSEHVMEGAGMTVRRSFPTPELDDVDPFLLLDHLGPMQFAPGQATGFPDHPHRGFETVTYVLEGAMEHRDSQGNHGIIGPGDVQWMTAGSGLVHSEMPGATLREKGGRLHGFQLWVNLPRSAKMTPPRYQEIAAARLPVAGTSSKDVEVKVIAGESLGKHAAIETRTPITYLHFTLQPGASVEQPIPVAYNAFAYVIDGSGAVGPNGTPAGEGQLAVFAKAGESVQLANPAGAKAPFNVLLIGGAPLGEPVARSGPFVMNTKAELYQAFEDFRSGRMGEIVAR
jgi:redox-sensitive bicupin YhaK (pirin superfamily)